MGDRCGALAPVEADLGMVSCVLPPRHSGAHKDSQGSQWATKTTAAKRRQRQRQKKRQQALIAELESQNQRLRSAASRALERCEVATDPSGAADEAASILAEVVALDGTYVPRDADKPMFEPPELDPDLRAGRYPRGVIDPNREPA